MPDQFTTTQHLLDERIGEMELNSRMATDELQPLVFVAGDTFEWPSWSKVGMRELICEFELGYDSPQWDTQEGDLWYAN